jgi:hypothetical protein
MALLSQRPVVVDMRFINPHVKKGDFYLIKSPVSGRNYYVYPRMVGRKKGQRYMPGSTGRFPVVEGLGDDGDSNYMQFFEASRDFRQAAISEAVDTAEELQQAAERFPRSNLNVPAVPSPAGSVSPGQGRDLMVFGLLALGAIGVGYVLLRKKD